jgi:diguanylate cyclase (GGDEF)-like protein/PAS domain S-box-containing protein
VRLRKMKDNFYKQLIEESPTGYAYHRIICDEDGNPCDYEILEINAALETLIGYKAIDLIGKRLSEIIPNNVQDELKWIKRNGKVAIHRNREEFEHFSETLKKWYRVTTYSPQKNYYITHFIDVSIEKEWFKTTLLSIGDGVIAFDNEGKVLLMNEIAEKLTEFKQDEAIGKSGDKVFRIVDEHTRKNLENPVNKVLEFGNSSTFGINDTLLVSKTNLEWPIEGNAARIRDQYNRTNGVVLLFREISEQRRKQKQIEYLSYYDIYNRRFFDEELKRLNTHRNLPLTLLMFDVNGLKLMNDAFGYKSGDELLRKVAEAMKVECRSDDIIARVGGDEFIIILPKTSSKQVEIIAKRIRDMISKEKVNSLAISVSFGCGTKKKSGEDIESILKEAVDQLYKRKLSESIRTRSKTIELIIETMFEDFEKEEHAKRVSELCESIGVSLQLDQVSISDLGKLGLMHDIGNIAIDNNILNKPDTLTDVEWSEIKRHPEIGYRILSSVNELAPLAKIILAHHERWDGTGYPRGLKDEKIPMKARILTVADAYDAMTSERPYRKAMSKDAAIEEIRRNSGIQFDPMIANLFIEKVLGQV